MPGKLPLNWEENPLDDPLQVNNLMYSRWYTWKIFASDKTVSALAKASNEKVLKTSFVIRYRVAQDGDHYRNIY